MTVAELKEALKVRGLVRSGNKSELIQRLVEHETQSTNGSTEENVEFDCPNCGPAFKFLHHLGVQLYVQPVRQKSIILLQKSNSLLI